MISEVKCCDCLDAMREIPDRFFEIAVVDPIYGGVTKGGYSSGKIHSKTTDFKKEYHLQVWEQEKTGKEYFSELFRISQNQVIWGGELLPKSYQSRFSVLACLG